MYDATVSVYDAIQDRITEVITIDGVTGHQEFHVSGLQLDARHDKLSIIANAGAAFDTFGADVSGTNYLVQYDLRTRKVEWKSNLTAVSQGAYGGFQDVEHDAAGNSFVIGSYPSSIVKVSADGKKAEAWYTIANTKTTVSGFSGIAAFNDGRTALVNDDGGRIFVFDLTAKKGTPVHLPLQAGAEPISNNTDASYLPALYKNTVYLVSDDAFGTIVLRSHNNWKTAEKLGVIPNAYAGQAFTTATVQIGDRLYVLSGFFLDNPHTRADFPLYDITDDVNKLLQQ